MTRRKTPPPLPIRVVRLHGKLVIAVAIGIAVAAALAAFEMRNWRARSPAGTSASRPTSRSPSP